MHARVDSGITIARSDVPVKLLEQLDGELSFANPKYLQRVRMGKHPGGELEVITVLERNRDAVRLPRGAIHLLRRLAGEEPVSCEDRRLLPKLVLEPMPDLELRDYQAALVDKLAKVTQGYAIVPCGGGKCVDKESLIFTNYGLLTAGELAKAIPPSHAAFTEIAVDTANGSDVTNAVYNGGSSATLRIRLALGYEIEVTPEHPLRVLRDGVLEWVRADNLHVGDRIVLRRGSNVWGHSAPALPFQRVVARGSSNTKLPSGLKLDTITAEACGLLVSEGTLTKERTIEFTNADLDNVEFVRRWAARHGLELAKNSSSEIQYTISSVVLREFLAWLGIDYTTAADKCIPRAIRTGGKDIMCAFLRGLFDGDASVFSGRTRIEFSSASKRLAQEVQIALLGLGILSSRRRKMVAGREHVYWRVSIDDVAGFARAIGFSSKRNADRLNVAIERVQTRKANPNVDTVPVNGLVRILYKAARQHSSWLRSDGRPFGNYVHGSNAPSRRALRRLIDRWDTFCAAESQPVKKLMDMPVAFLPIEAIDPSTSGVVDLSVPDSHEFVANGVVCHNTVMGLGAIARLRTPALILVHTIDLADQWMGELRRLLGIEPGLVGGGKENIAPVTVALVQTLVRWEWAKIDAFLEQFGLLIADECHHLPASTFRTIIDRAPARYRLGLTATPEREDGLGPMLDLYFGPPLVTVTHEELRAAGVLSQATVRVVETDFDYPYDDIDDYAPMLTALAHDPARNALLVRTIAREAHAGHTCLVLSGRVEHCMILRAALEGDGVRAEVLTSGVKRKVRKALLDGARSGEIRVLIATSLADEGLDVPRLSRAFLTFPARAKGRAIQRLGRLMRLHDAKTGAVLFDFVDSQIPILKKHYLERRKAFAAVLGIPVAQIGTRTEAA